MSSATDPYRFIISIPVADRPAQLRSCLESIYQLCRLYNYGGQDIDGRYAKITVVVAEDSRDAQHVGQHRALVAEYCARGLEVIHFDLPEQYRLLHSIPEPRRRQLGRLLTTQPAERFYRKGQAANRNLSYLKMLALTQDKGRTLYYLVDSDQLFLSELDYFHHIDHIFRTTDTLMLTGKLVGDPPVSPAVMAGNFLDDVTAFLHEIAGYAPQGACRFHRDATLPGDAAYHDMAAMFGFDPQADHFEYRCPLSGEHDHAACLAAFTHRLHAFFFGEHLTRKTAFHPSTAPTELTPARTVYPGNYIVNFDGLKYIIPFGHLRLRMSGPTAGRLIQAEIGGRFASANLPMLHERTTGSDTQGGFRPGVERQEDAAVDISDEFERQFFGDLMLFSVVEWLKQYDLAQLVDGESLLPVVEKVEADLLALYQAQHDAINKRLPELKQWIVEEKHWWHGTSALHRVSRFLRNIELNFGDESQAWRQIQSASHRKARKQQITDALMGYQEERKVWDEVVGG